MTSPRLRNRTGFALLATMWLSVAIASVALAFALEARQARVSVMSLSQSTQALAAARAGVATTLARLDYLVANGTIPPSVNPIRSFPVTRDDPWHYADSLLTDQVDLGGGAGYRVRVRDLGSLFDLSGTAADWRNFLDGMHIDVTTADRLSQTILDWTDLDDNPQANGAERTDYIAAGRVVLPPNKQISAVSELRDVLGMTPFIYDSIAPYISAYHRGTLAINVNTAPGPVLRIIPPFDDDVVATILSRRVNGTQFKTITDLLPLIPSALANAFQQRYQGQLQFTTDRVEITSIGWGPDGRTRVISRVVVQRPAAQNNTVNQIPPVSIVQWRRDD